VTRNRRNGKKLLAAAAVTAVAVLGIVAFASALTKVTLKSVPNNIEATFEGGATPKALPKKGTAPVTLILNGKMKSLNGEHLKALDTVTLDFDKAGKINTKGLASCTVAKLLSTTTKDAEKKCRSAIVGKGNVQADIALPEQPPFGASGPLVVFNGSKGGKQELILHVYAHVPAATTFVVPVKLGKDHGKFGTKAFIDVPKIVSGNGSVTSFKAKINKKFTSGGKKQSLLNAGCPKGSLAVKGDFKFAGGGDLTGELTVPCTPKG
jgi:hypothetical protein